MRLMQHGSDRPPLFCLLLPLPSFTRPPLPRPFAFALPHPALLVLPPRPRPTLPSSSSQHCSAHAAWIRSEGSPGGRFQSRGAAGSRAGNGVMDRGAFIDGANALPVPPPAAVPLPPPSPPSHHPPIPRCSQTPLAPASASSSSLRPGTLGGGASPWSSCPPPGPAGSPPPPPPPSSATTAAAPRTPGPARWASSATRGPGSSRRSGRCPPGPMGGSPRWAWCAVSRARCASARSSS